jgi:hypothetical protein
MVKKCFIILQFGKPHEWTQQFIDHVLHLEQYGFFFQIYTPNPFQSQGNVQIIPMTIDEFNTLTEKKLGINPEITILPSGIPSIHVTDFLVFLGSIFAEYLTDYDYWGTIGLDCVIGRLDHFVPDEHLKKYDIWTDDIGQFNANFFLQKNTERLNNLCTQIPDWQEKLTQPPCPGCAGTGAHSLAVTDENGMSQVLRDVSQKDVRYGYPPYHLFHSHDRLENHVPIPKLQITADGSLWDLIADTKESRHPLMGREIAYFHFSTTKQWPL